MSKKNIGLLLLLLALGAIYIFNFTNLFYTQQIEITSKIRPAYSRPSRSSRSSKRPPTPPPANTVSFSLNNKYKLTSVKVVEEQDFKTNKYPHALWHLVAEGDPVPTKTIIYGVPLEGMKSKVAKIKPETLRTNISYVLLLEADNLKGQTTFKMR